MKRLSCPCCNIKECVITWATDQSERGHYESDSMAVKIDVGDDNPAADPCCVAGKMVCGISASLFGMVFLSAGQCAIGNGDAFVPDAAIKLHADVKGAGKLAAFGSANPITDENYTAGDFTSYRGVATAIVQSGYEAGLCTLTVSGEGFEEKSVELKIK